MLERFDVVGTTDCLLSVLRAVDVKFGWPPDLSHHAWLRMTRYRGKHRPRELIREQPRAVHPGQAAYEQTHWVRWELLNVSARSQLQHTVERCDLPLYRAALKRAEQTLPTGCNDAKTPSTFE